MKELRMNRSGLLFGLSFLVAGIAGEALPENEVDSKDLLWRVVHPNYRAEKFEKSHKGINIGISPSDHLTPVKSYNVNKDSVVSTNNADDGKFRTTADKADAVLIGNTFCLFAPNVTQDNKQCVYDSILLSELASNKQVPPKTPEAMKKWYEKFNDVLPNIGWDFTSFDFSMIPIEIRESQFSAATEFEKILASLITKGYFSYLGPMKPVDDFKAMVNAVENDKSGRYASIYSNCSQQYKTSLFNIVIVTQSFNLDPLLTMSVFGLDVNVSPNKINILWSPYPSKSVRLLFGQERMVLDKDAFKQVQAVIEQKLGDRLKYDILDIPI